ncbi:hypothetical protein Tco_0127910 [Tanacetum coccineum]
MGEAWMWILKRHGYNAIIERLGSKAEMRVFCPYPTKLFSGLVVGRYTNESVLVIMAGRNARSGTVNNINPPNETADEVTRQLNTALLNLLTQLVQALGGN